MSKIRKKLPVCLRFFDHFQKSGNDFDLPVCEVYGLLIAEDKLKYVIASWAADDTIDDNTEIFIILKSTIIERIDLKQGRVTKGPSA